MTRITRRSGTTSTRAYNTELKTFSGLLWAVTVFRGNKPIAELTASKILAETSSRRANSAVQTRGPSRSPSSLDQLVRPFARISCSGRKVWSQLLTAQVNGGNKAVTGTSVPDR
jgi:hypothetical protein